MPSSRLMQSLASQGCVTITVAFQPIVGRGRRLWAWEALMRGVGVSGDVMPPAAILQAAVRDGVILELGGWMRSLAVQRFGWLDRLGMAPAHLCINARRDEVMPADFIKGLTMEAEEAGIAPGRIIIELTEDRVSANPDLLLLRRRQIGDAGLLFALDDCCPDSPNDTTHIERLAPEIVKIDLRMLSHPEMAIEAGAIVASARSTGALIVVEWVQSEDQFDTLLRSGIDLFQGRLFGL